MLVSEWSTYGAVCRWKKRSKSALLFEWLGEMYLHIIF